MAMNIIEKLANTMGRTKGQYLKGLDTVFSTTGSHPTANDDSAFIDLELWGADLLSGKEPKTKKEFIRAFRGFVYICAKLNSQTVASQRLRLYVAKKEKTKTYRTIETRPLSSKQKTWIYSRQNLDPWLTKAADVEEITSHVWIDLMKNVNPQHNSRDLKEYTVLYQDLTGECYWWLEKGGLGIPERIWPIPSQFINPVFSDSLDQPIKSYIYNTGATKVEIPEDQIIFFTYPNPNNVFTGFGCVKGIATAVYLREQMDDFEKALFENKARIGGILSPETGVNISKEARKRLKEDFAQQYVGAKKAGQLVIPPVGMKLEKDTMTPGEMNYMEGRFINMEEIALGFDIPPGALTSKGVNLANAKVADYRHSKNGILPRCSRFEDKLNEKFLPLYADNIFCAFDNPVPEDRALVLKEQTERVKSGLSTRDEVRAEQGLEPMGGLADELLVDNRLVPINSLGMGGEADEEEIREFTEKVIKNVKGVLG